MTKHHTKSIDKLISIERKVVPKLGRNIQPRNFKNRNEIPVISAVINQGTLILF